jgi:transposase
MTRNEVIMRAIAKEISWIQAAHICQISDRQMRRLKRRYEHDGYKGLVDRRHGRARISLATLEQVCTLKRERYPDFTVQHFWEQLQSKHGLGISYTWTKITLQAAGIVEKSPGRGRYRRRRERRPLRGMMVHLDASRHRWLPAVPMQDLVVAMDDADGRILYARFVPEEGTASTLAALKHILTTYGRFAELYTDRGSHFCHTAQAGGPPTTEHGGDVSRALKVLGIRQILAYSPQARGRSERAFETIQGRLPQELRVAGITTYEAANTYLHEHFVPDFNERFTVVPTQPASAFVPVVGVDLELLLSAQHSRIVQNDSTVFFRSRCLQLPRTAERAHYVRCPVTVHEFPEGTLGLSYQGRELARYAADGTMLPSPPPPRARPTPRRGARLVGGPHRSPPRRARPTTPVRPQKRAVQPGGHFKS